MANENNEDNKFFHNLLVIVMFILFIFVVVVVAIETEVVDKFKEEFNIESEWGSSSDETKDKIKTLNPFKTT